MVQNLPSLKNPAYTPQSRCTPPGIEIGKAGRFFGGQIRGAGYANAFPDLVEETRRVQGVEFMPGPVATPGANGLLAILYQLIRARPVGVNSLHVPGSNCAGDPAATNGARSGKQETVFLF